MVYQYLRATNGGIAVYITYFKSGDYPSPPCIFPCEMRATDRRKEWVCIDYDDMASKKQGSVLDLGDGDVKIIYVDTHGVAEPMGLRLRRSSLKNPKVHDLLWAIYGTSHISKAVLQIASRGKDMLSVEPAYYYGPHGGCAAEERYLNNALGRHRLPAKLGRREQDQWRRYFRQFQDALNQMRPSQKRTLRQQWLDKCKAEFANQWRIEW